MSRISEVETFADEIDEEVHNLQKRVFDLQFQLTLLKEYLGIDLTKSEIKFEKKGKK